MLFRTEKEGTMNISFFPFWFADVIGTDAVWTVNAGCVFLVMVKTKKFSAWIEKGLVYSFVTWYWTKLSLIHCCMVHSMRKRSSISCWAVDRHMPSAITRGFSVYNHKDGRRHLYKGDGSILSSPVYGGTVSINIVCRNREWRVVEYTSREVSRSAIRQSSLGSTLCNNFYHTSLSVSCSTMYQRPATLWILIVYYRHNP